VRICSARIFRRKLFHLAELDVGGLDARPFRAAAEKPAARSDDARGVERVAGDEQLHLLPRAQIGADNVVLGRAVGHQHQHLDRVAEVIVIELIVADAVQLHRLVRRQHEIERRAHRAPGLERRRQAARRDPLRTHERDAHIPAGGVRFEIEELADIVVAHVLMHGSPLCRPLRRGARRREGRGAGKRGAGYEFAPAVIGHDGHRSTRFNRPDRRARPGVRQSPYDPAV
jgi:hypothetical protein